MLLGVVKIAGVLVFVIGVGMLVPEVEMVPGVVISSVKVTAGTSVLVVVVVSLLVVAVVLVVVVAGVLVVVVVAVVVVSLVCGKNHYK